MTELIAISTAQQLVVAVFAALLLLFVLRRFDKSLGRDIKSTLDRIHDNAMAAALYLGLRFVGAAILVGLVLS